MKKFTHPIIIALCSLCLAQAISAANWTAGMKEGKAQLQSMGPLAFGPDGILFAADTKAAAIVAIATGDTTPAHGSTALKVEGINQKVAGLLGTAADQILIDDMVVNPISHNVYLAVSRGRGPTATPVLVRVKGDGKLAVASLDDVKFSEARLPDAPVDGVQRQANPQSNPRRAALTELCFLEDGLPGAASFHQDIDSSLRVTSI